MAKVLIVGVFFSSLLILLACQDKRENVTDYWKRKNGESKVVSQKFTLKNGKFDGYCYRYYENGQLHSKALYRDNRLVKIEQVFDPNGNKVNFGKLDEYGTGFVITYSRVTGRRSYSGYYQNGVKEGWWKNYLSEGLSNDSVFYRNGHPDFMPSLYDVLY